MWKVLRRYQGEGFTEPGPLMPDKENDAHPQTSSAADPVEFNLRQIYLHETKHYAKPMDPNNLTAPYDRLIYDKCVRYMTHELVPMRRKALAMLLELYVQKKEHVVLSIKHAETCETLVGKCLQDEDDDVRTHACICLEYIAQQRDGQNYLIENGFLKPILAALDDKYNDTVVEALRVLCALHAVHNGYSGTATLLKLGCVAKYVERSKHTHDGVSCMAFAALGKVFDVKEAFIQVLANGGMEAATQAIATREDPLVMIEACELVGKLAFYGAGKRAGVANTTVKYATPLLKNADVAVRTAASGALMALTIIEDGKLQAIDAQIVDTVMAAIAREDERDVLVNELKIMCNVAEHPIARLQLNAAMPRLEELQAMGSDVPGVPEAVEKAIRAVRWMPGDQLV